MKNSIYIYALLASFLIISCGDDDYSIAYEDLEVKTPLTADLQLSRDVAAPTTRLDFTVTLPQSFSTDATLEVTVLTPDFNTARASLDVPAGETTVSGFLTMPGSGTITNSFFGIEGFYSIQVTGLALVQPEEGMIDDPFTLSSEELRVDLIDYNSDYMAARETSLDVLLDWQGPWDVNDLDMYIVNMDTGELYENAESGSRYEGDLFNNTHPDGTYAVAVSFYSVSGEDIAYNFNFTYPNGEVEFYEGVFTSPAAGDYLPEVMYITKSTDVNGNAVYTTSQP